MSSRTSIQGGCGGVKGEKAGARGQRGMVSVPHMMEKSNMA